MRNLFPISGGRITTSRNNLTGMIVAEVLANSARIEVDVDGNILVEVAGKNVHISASGEVTESVRAA